VSRHSSDPVSHPYVRISHPTQRKGGGLERQTTADLAEFNRLYGFTLSRRMLVDDGISAFKGLNATPDHALGKFLAEARRGLIPAGDCLLIENYDRLSRQDQWAAIGLVSELRSLKIHVGRLDRMKLLRWDSDDPGDFFEAAVEFMRGHSESRAKSLRNGAAWKHKRKAARENGTTITRWLPAWVREVDGARQVIPERAAVVKRIFHLAASGYGNKLIVKTLTDDKVPTFFKGKRRKRGSGPKSEPLPIGDHWTPSYVALILSDRRVLGEFQPKTTDGKEAGQVLKGYYPAVVSEAEFYAARAGAQERRNNPGRTSTEFINLFAGLLTDVVTNTSLFAETRVYSGQKNKVLISTAAAEGLAPCLSFPVPLFDRAVLSCLRDINPKEIIDANGHDEVAELEGRLAALDSRMAALERELVSGDVPSISRVLRGLESSRKDTAAKLAAARQKAAHPLSASWGEAQSLLDVLDQAGDPMDVRLRLRAALRRIVESIHVLIVPRGYCRLAALQVRFAGSERHRDYLILARRMKANGRSRTAGGWWCCELDDAVRLGPRDLRKPEDARKVEAFLAGVPLEATLAVMQQQPSLKTGGASA
jgi:DNA invertase Pin-like site-specific DNA recombinase